jgi:hypothetical protein
VHLRRYAPPPGRAFGIEIAREEHCARPLHLHGLVRGRGRARGRVRGRGRARATARVRGRARARVRVRARVRARP